MKLLSILIHVDFGILSFISLDTFFEFETAAIQEIARKNQNPNV
jgi:hypothetical protein